MKPWNLLSIYIKFMLQNRIIFELFLWNLMITILVLFSKLEFDWIVWNQTGFIPFSSHWTCFFLFVCYFDYIRLFWFMCRYLILIIIIIEMPDWIRGMLMISYPKWCCDAWMHCEFSINTANKCDHNIYYTILGFGLCENWQWERNARN